MAAKYKGNDHGYRREIYTTALSTPLAFQPPRLQNALLSG